MARVIKLDKRQYADDGLLPLFRGDDWSVIGKVVDRVGSYESEVDMSPYSATGYFPAATGGSDLPVSAATGECGSVTISVPKEVSPNIALSNGIGAYIVLQDQSGNLQTVPTIGTDIAVLDRGFPT